jgi:hypothetical protein
MKGRPGIRFMGVNVLGRLARLSGWTVTDQCDEAIHQIVRLDKTR